MSGGSTIPTNPQDLPHADTEPTSIDDPASSLRAAALLTLKSKRKRAPGDKPAVMVIPSRPDPSAVLDYGTDEISSSNAIAATDDIAAREEGEISDTEEQMQEKIVKQSPPPRSAPLDTRGKPTALELPRPSTPPSTNSLTMIPKLESPAPVTSTAMFGQQSHTPMDINNDEILMDPLHVRPGLEMTQSQLDNAKDIVLDLLGWGVPPEYLVDCGLSREIVFFVFTELHLRLPDNLDTTGLMPFILPTPSRQSSILRDVHMLSPPSDRFPLMHPSLPPKPSVASENGSLSRSTHIRSSPVSTVDEAGVTNLHDLERQRRQELLARKAVQASRKVKSVGQSSKNTYDDPVDSSDRPPSLSAVVPSETVDDFLNSIKPSSESKPGADFGFPPRYNDDSMDVDDISGLGGDTPISTHLLPQSTEPRRSISTERSASFPPPSSTLTDFSQSNDLTTPLSSKTPDISQTITRKRPVAADFVDVEYRGGDHAPSNSRRFKRGSGSSFASASAMRRCVIDLSDTEDDVDGYPDASVFSLISIGIPGDGGLSIPQLSGNPPGSHRTNSPAVLMEKEKEILKMRAMIAEKEKIRVEKLSRLNTVSNTTVVKQEEAESQYLTLPRNNSHASASVPSIPDISASPITDSSLIDSSRPFSFTSSPEDGLHNRTARDSVDNDVKNLGKEPVDDDLDISASTQRYESLELIPQPTSKSPNGFTELGAALDEEFNYTSPFDLYPTLRSHPRLFAVAPRIPVYFPKTSLSLSSSSHRNLSIALDHISSVPDLNPLKMGVVNQALNPFKPLCQYEVPGGGVCRDVSCENNHPSRIFSSDRSNSSFVVNVSDQETAEYLIAAMFREWSSNPDVLKLKIINALQQVRSSKPSATIEERVATILMDLNLPK